MIEHHGLEAVGLQEAAHRHAEAAVAGDDDPRARLINHVGITAVAAAGKERLDELVIEDHQQRRQRHGHGDNRHQQRALLGGEKAKAQAEGDQHEGELAALRQREGEARGVGRSHAEELGEDEQHQPA